MALTSAAPSPPSTLTGPAAPAPPASSSQGTSSLRGGSTLDRVELPMKGPTRGSFAVVGAITGLLGIALGAALAYRGSKVPETIPVTPVGLIGEPAAVVAVREVDAGAAPSRGASARPARPGASRPAGTPAARETSPAPSGTPPRGTEPTTANGTPSRTQEPSGGSAPPARGATEPTRAAQADAGAARGGESNALPPPDPGGVIERGPRVTSGGYGLGDETDATGTMDGRVFSYVYNHYKSQISACYSSASRSRAVSGVIVLRVRIGTDGRVARTRVISDSARVPELAQCVQNAVRAWRYPQPEGGEVEVDYPMRFGSSS